MAVIPPNTHVVVVEDNPNNMLVILKLLKLIGIEQCNWYTSGRQVVDFVKCISQSNAEQRPDLILLDIGLPSEDGYAVLAELRADPTLQHTRVVAVTARATHEEVQRARQAGFDGFIGKPINPQRFPEQIRQILAGEGLWEPV